MDFHEQPTPDRMSADVQKAAAHSTFSEFAQRSNVLPLIRVYVHKRRVCIVSGETT